MTFFKNNGRLILQSLLMLILLTSIILREENDSLTTLDLILFGCIVLPFFLQKVDYAIWMIICLAPISLGIILPVSSIRLSVPTELLSIVLLLTFGVKLLGGLSFNRRIFHHPITILFILDICWSLISATHSEMTEVSVKRVLMKVLFISVYFIIFSNQLNSIRKQKSLYLLYAIGALYPIYSAISTHAARGFGHNTAFNISAPFYSDHTIYGACLSFILPFLVIFTWDGMKNKTKGNTWMWLLTGVFVVAIVLSYSRASWISLMVALLFLLLTKIRVKTVQLISGVAIVILVAVLNFDAIYSTLSQNETKYGDDVATHISSVTNLQNDQSNLERINRWVCAYRMFEDEPVFGFGPGTYQFIYDRYQTPEFMTRISTHRGDRGNAHSEYLSALSETGIVGFILFVLLALYVVHTGLKSVYSNLERHERLIVLSALLGLITFYIHGLFNTFSDIEKMGILVYGSIGILVFYDLKASEK